MRPAGFDPRAYYVLVNIPWSYWEPSGEEEWVPHVRFLQQLTADGLLQQPNCGKKTLRRIQEYAASRGVTIA